MILAQALALADEQGLAAVSMRAVAARLGLTSMALYPYVGTKQQLLDGLVELLLTELVSDLAGHPDWRQQLRAVGRGLRALAVAHPGAYPLLILRPDPGTAATHAVVEPILAALLDAGVPEPEVPRLQRLFLSVALGYPTAELTGWFAGPQAADLPAHRRLRRWLTGPVDPVAEFEADLDDLIRLVGAGVRR